MTIRATASDFTSATFSYDFSGPYMSATIITKDGVRFPLWMQSALDNLYQQQLPSAQEGRFSEIHGFPYLSELIIKQGLGVVPVITAVLTPPFREGIAFLDSELIEWGVSRIEVQFGYAGGKNSLSVPYTGLLLKPDVSMGTDITITLNAQGVPGFGAIREEGTKVFNSQTPLQIMTQIAHGANGTRDLFIETRLVAEGSHSEKLLNEPLRHYTSGGRSDLFCIIELATRCLCWVQMTENLAVLVPRETLGTGEPSKRFRFMDYPDGKIGPDVSEFPILSFSSPSPAVFLPGVVKGLVAGRIDSERREYERLAATELGDLLEANPIVGTTSVATKANIDSTIRDFKPTLANPSAGEADKTGDKETKKLIDDLVKANKVPPKPKSKGVKVIKGNATPRTAKGSSQPTFSSQNQKPDADGDGMAFFPKEVKDKPELAKEMTAIWQQSGSQAGVHIEIETLGIPDLFPGELIQVSGCGIRLDSNYGIFDVTHRLNSSGYSTSFTAISNVQKMLSDGVAALGIQNNQETPKASAADSAVVEPKGDFVAPNGPPPVASKRPVKPKV